VQTAPNPLVELRDITAVIFDLDGVVTNTASVHMAAWKQLFDEYLSDRASGGPFVPFTHDDYIAYVDGKLRYDGVQSFLDSRGIELPLGDPEDGPETETICGLGNRKNQMFHRVLKDQGAAVFPTTVAWIQRLRSETIKIGCVSSSANCRPILKSVDLLHLFDHIIDGIDARTQCLPGKPAPDTYVECARRLDTEPASSAIVEDAVSGVASGAAGGFRYVIGVNRGAGRDELVAAGATVVVDDLGEFL
jgi:beta-phosphoglucomutase family hydrolase